ncbi:hypothetical protein NITGR_90018 [Nitrospina gracilis 3/211]|uniref:Uncharacterized protein n=1 Tax=Nitrospina gracilis (strain 3/211) TaxID=1266370 RepID=M1ZE99_NITG3|nr:MULTISPECIES: hypothetical protein [Nitrospina]MCF8722453.1 hypothetical protein [Nitrospina sp. Nb-3]CCQ91879.1 hypothetical protein NITGR_90018 [Nitrospina gracilis 3/211]
MVYPDLNWYTSISKENSLIPRCPFATVTECPRFFQSLSLLKELGTTELSPQEDEKLLNLWEKSDLWPKIKEEATSVWGGKYKNLSNFCPEVSYLRYGLFASDLHSYSDEIDLEVAHHRLGNQKSLVEDWRWEWEKIREMHYTDCPLYSPLKFRSSLNSKTESKILSLTPSLYGIKLDIPALWHRKIKPWLDRLIR